MQPGVHPREGDALAGPAFISTLPAGPGERRLALGLVLISIVVFACAAPFARRPLPAVPAFLPVYQSALVINELITALLLFGQFGILRSRSLLILGAGYLLNALMAVAHALSFPGLFAPSGVIGGGGQTTAWIYFLWHGAFPAAVIAYARAAARERTANGPARAALGPVLVAIAAAAAIAVALVMLAAAGNDALPAIMQGDRDAPTKVYVAAVTWALSLLSLPLLWRRRPLTVLDLWLMVVMCVWVFDVALAAVLNAGRYDVGWYAGRIYGLLAGSFVLGVLLLENGRLYAELVQVRARERRRAREDLARHAERLRLLHQIDVAIVAREAPRAIAGAVIERLRDLLAAPRAAVGLLHIEPGEVEWLASAGRRRTQVGPGPHYPLRLMGDLEALRRGEPQIVRAAALPPGPEADALRASGIAAYAVVPMISGGELIGALSFGGEDAPFAHESLAIAREVATQLAIAITQARLLEGARRHADELESRVEERTAALQAANRELEAFSYSVSHDLRAPLRAVHGYAAMLQEDYAPRLDEEGQRLIAVVRESASRMDRLIEDLLRFSRTSRAPLALAALDMAALVRGVVADLAPGYPAARISIGGLPAARADAGLLKQVWANLVGNALKYSARRERASVEIAGREEGEEVIYRVQDNGAGFDMRYAEKLFKVFQRLHRAEEFEGTGVGLAIVQRIVTRHGGRVWADGSLGAGARFFFSLPRDASEAGSIDK